MSGSLSMNSWLLGKSIFRVSRTEFVDALAYIDRQIKQESGQTPNLSIAFCKAAHKLQEDFALNEPNLIGKAPVLSGAPCGWWRQADLIVATFTTAASDDKPRVSATVSLGNFDRHGERTRHEMHFRIDPEPLGSRIGYRMLNEDPDFMFWNKGILP